MSALLEAARAALNDLEAVLCDPEGRAGIRGSDADNAIINTALDALRTAIAAAEAQPTELEAMVDKAWSRFEAEDQRLKVKKSERVHALVNAGHFPGMSEAFDAHMGAACWTDPAYAPDASTWAAAWRASKAQPVGEPVAWGGLTEGERAQAVQSIFEYGTGFVAPLFAVIEGVERTLERRNTAPPAQPAREPLTDEQISELFKSWRVGSLYMHIARGVERAHGIGSQQ